MEVLLHRKKCCLKRILKEIGSAASRKESQIQHRTFWTMTQNIRNPLIYTLTLPVPRLYRTAQHSSQDDPLTLKEQKISSQNLTNSDKLCRE